MADIKFSEFPKATESKNTDEIAILQDGVNKTIQSPILESKIITRTVEELSKEGGISLNLVNLKSVVATYTNLPTTGLQINDAYQVKSDGLVYVWNGTSFQPNGQGFKVQPEVNGIVEKDNINAVNGGEVFKKVNPIYNVVGIDAIYNKNTNFIAELQGSLMTNTDLWESGAYWQSTGEKREVADFVRTKKLYKLPAGDYVFHFEMTGNNYGYCFFDENGVYQYGGTSGTSDFNITLNRTLYLGFSQRLNRPTTLLKTENINDIIVYKDSEFVKKNELDNLIDNRFEEITDIEVIPTNTNFVEELNNSLFSNTELWSPGYLAQDGNVNPTAQYWHFTNKYYLLKAGYYDFNLYFTGNAKMIFYNLNQTVKQTISNPNTGVDLYNQSMTITEDVLVRFSYRQINELPNVTLLLSIINTKPISAFFVTSNNIKDYLPNSGNSAIRQLFLDKYKPKRLRPIVTLISDDGFPINLGWYKEILDEFNVKSTFALVGQRVKNADNGINLDTSITSAQAKQLYLDGHDIASHTWTHTNNMTSQTLDVIDDELSKTKIFLQNITFDSVNMFISPFGVRNSDIDNIVSRYYDANFITAIGAVYNKPVLNRFNMIRTSFDAPEANPTLLWSSTLKPSLDNIISNNGWVIFAVHPQYTQYNSWENATARREELRTLLQYCKDNNIDVVTAKKGYEYYKNHVDIGVPSYDAKNYRLGMNNEEINNNYF